jgi:hypothetical protein
MLPLMVEPGGQRAADGGDVFAIDGAERPVGKPLADILLVLRMDVLRIAEVDGDGHAGLGQASVFSMDSRTRGQPSPGEVKFGSCTHAKGSSSSQSVRQLVTSCVSCLW